MFSVRQKRMIADGIQKLLQDTHHPELPKGEITFRLYVEGTTYGSWADIRNNSAVPCPSINPWNEQQDHKAVEVAKDSAKAVQILAKASYAPSPEAREKIEKNCDGCQRSGESKISFRGPLPINRAGNA